MKIDLNEGKEKIKKLNEDIENIKNELIITKKSNDNLQNEINNYKNDFQKIRNEISLKNENIIELQKKASSLELDLRKKNNELNKKNEKIKNEKNDELNIIKNKYEQTIKKLQQLTEENNSLKKTLNISSAPTTYSSKNISKNFSNNNDDYDFNNNDFNNYNIPLKRYISNNRRKHYTVNEKNSNYHFDNNIIDKDNTMNIFPCQKEQVKKESLIVEIESKLYKLQRERDKLNDELFKLPEFPKKKIEINQRRELELKIEQYNKNINDQKTKLRELNKVK